MIFSAFGKILVLVVVFFQHSIGNVLKIDFSHQVGSGSWISCPVRSDKMAHTGVLDLK